MSNPRPDWDDYFLGIAEAVSARGDCTRRQVGCVLVGHRHQVISTGYNGAPSGEPGCLTAGACPRGQHSLDVIPARSQYTDGAGRCIAVHAEDNALRYAGRRVNRIATAYVTCEPCGPCHELLRDAGIDRVVWTEGSQ